jgi:hypothetical protein
MICSKILHPLSPFNGLVVWTETNFSFSVPEELVYFSTTAMRDEFF